MIWGVVTGRCPDGFVSGWVQAVVSAIDNAAFRASTLEQSENYSGFVVHRADDGLIAPYPGRGVLRTAEGIITIGGTEVVADFDSILRRLSENNAVVPGQYSVAIRRNSDVMVVNDFYGIEPIYFAEAGFGWIISSDLRAVLAAPSFSIQANPSYVAAKVDVSNIGSDSDLPTNPAYLGVAKLPFATSARFPLDGSAPELVSRAIDLPSAAPFAGDFNEAVEEFEAILRRVMLGVRAFTPKLTLDLSGGIDSGLLAACACEIFPNNTLFSTTMSVGDNNSYLMSDAPLVAQFQKINGLRGIQIDMADAMDVGAVYPPFLGARSVANYGYLVEAYRYSRDSGCLGRMTGEGGDYHLLGTDMVGDCGPATWRGNPSDLGLIGFRKRMPPIVRSIAAPALRQIPMLHDRLYRRALWSENEFKSLQSMYINRPAKHDMLESAKALRTRQMPWFRRFQYDMLFPRASYMDEFAHFPVPHFAPYLDAEVIQFAFTLPADYLIDPKRHSDANDYEWSKRLLRASFSTTFPTDLAHKRIKTDYNDMTVRYIRGEFDYIKAELDEILDHHQVGAILNKHHVTSLARRTKLISELPGSSFGVDAIMILALVDLNRWLKAIARLKPHFLRDAFANYRI